MRFLETTRSQDTMFDPAFPRLHPRPDHGWLNDPNGVCRIDGRWHVFFQWNPDSTRHEQIHWGHVSSPDLLHWQQEPVALTPRAGRPDSAGCWTGCVVDDAGTPTAVYSAVSDHSGNADVLLAHSDRTLRQWHQDDHAVLPMPEDPRFTDVRDPFVIEYGGHRWAVLGAGSRHGSPAVLSYRVDDLTKWIPAGTLVDDTDPVAAELDPVNIWECPNLLPVGDRWVLIISLWQSRATGSNHGGVGYLVGDLEVTDDLQLRFHPTTTGTLDAGGLFYAPQAMAVDDRILLWGWVCEDRDDQEAAAAGWAGCLTQPRELQLTGDRLVSRPATELADLIGAELSTQQPITAPAFMIRLDGPGTLQLDGVDVLSTDGAAQVWVDGSLVESYPLEGVAHTVRAYPKVGSSWSVSGPAQAYVLRLPADHGPKSVMTE